ncbi:MAG: hypothetical protein GX596_12465 [Propionibacterium sp.]|nr:hypothetical protein [Propionibacterium sp.]
MGLFSDLDLSGDMPLRARPLFGSGPAHVHSTKFKRMMRIVVPIVSVAFAVGLFFLGRMFYLMLTGQ